VAEEKRKVINKKEVTMTIPVVKVPGWMQGFVDFIREQGVVGLAVGFILGVAAKGVVDSLVNNVVNPLVGILYGGGGQLNEKFWCLKDVGGVCTNKLGYGALINTLINFLIVAAVVYLILKSLKLDRLDKKKS
jgi:large conductance mechanosensitive channel